MRGHRFGLLALACGLLVPVADAATPPSAASAAPHGARPRTLAPANFFVEWRIRPASEAGASAGHGLVVTSNSATTGGSGFWPGAVVVGTAQQGGPYGGSDAGVQGVRVANGRQAVLRFDRIESTMVWDASWSARARARAPASSGAGMAAGPGFSAQAQESGAAGHEELVHHVQGLRVVPRWTSGDTVELELEVTRQGDASDPRDLDLHSTVEARFDEWLAVARLQGEDELQVRVSRR